MEKRISLLVLIAFGIQHCNFKRASVIIRVDLCPINPCDPRELCEKESDPVYPVNPVEYVFAFLAASREIERRNAGMMEWWNKVQRITAKKSSLAPALLGGASVRKQ